MGYKATLFQHDSVNKVEKTTSKKYMCLRSKNGIFISMRNMKLSSMALTTQKRT